MKLAQSATIIDMYSTTFIYYSHSIVAGGLELIS
jgi:hypothetical protein